MVYALREIHKSLSPDGVLLDIHPQPVNSRIEVWQEGRTHDLGEIDKQALGRVGSKSIVDARARLELLVEEGLFAPEASDFFEIREHYDSVASWQEKRVEEGYQPVAPPEMFESANELLNSGGGELVIREQVRATRLRRLEVDTS